MDSPSETKKRLCEFAYQIGSNKRQMTKTMGVSEGFFGSHGGMAEDKLVMIVRKFPQLNMNWLLTGEGEMITGKTGGTDEEKERRTQQKDTGERKGGIEELITDTVKQATMDGIPNIIKAVGDVVTGVIASQKDVAFMQLEVLKEIVGLLTKSSPEAEKERINLKLEKLDRKIGGR